MAISAEAQERMREAWARSIPPAYRYREPTPDALRLTGDIVLPFPDVLRIETGLAPIAFEPMSKAAYETAQARARKLRNHEVT